MRRADNLRRRYNRRSGVALRRRQDKTRRRHRQKALQYRREFHRVADKLNKRPADFHQPEFLSVSAAAAAVAVSKKNKRYYDDEPDVVIIEKIAKAIHGGSSG